MTQPVRRSSSRITRRIADPEPNAFAPSVQEVLPNYRKTMERLFVDSQLLQDAVVKRSPKFLGSVNWDRR